MPALLASGGAGLFVDQSLNYNVLEKTLNEAFRVLWVEVSFVNHKNIVCGIIYGQHNSPDYFLTYLDKTIEILVSDDKDVYIMGDFNIDLLKCESSQMSQDFLLSLRSCYLITTEDKLTRVIELLSSWLTPSSSTVLTKSSLAETLFLILVINFRSSSVSQRQRKINFNKLKI